MNKREAGSSYEAQARRFLEEKGFRILSQNFRSRNAEIDLVAAEGRYLVFIEVKQRSTFRHGYGMDAVDERKQRRICQAARYYLFRNRIPPGTPVRFDVVSIDAGKIRLIRNAFLWK